MQEREMDASDSQAVIVTTTADSKELLAEIASNLVRNELAACCQISGPVTSVYRWQGNIDRSTEWLCTIKSMPALVDQVVTMIKTMHSYDEPEIIVTPVIGGSISYLQWIEDSVRTN